MNVVFSKKHTITLANKIIVHLEIVMPATIIGLLLVFCEFVAMSTLLDDNFPRFHVFIWLPTVFLFLYLLYLCIKTCIFHFRAKERNYVQVATKCAIYISVLFLIEIYCYALPTFLLLLVYPTKVIAVVVYLITFTFSSSVIFSISVRLIKRFKELFNKVETGRLFCCLMSLNILLFSITPILVFVIMIQFIYALVLGEASAITAGPYTILSLIPSAIVSAVTWMLKNKMFGGEEEDDTKKKDKDDDSTNDESTSENIPQNNDETGSQDLALVVQNTNTPKPTSRSGYGTVPTDNT